MARATVGPYGLRLGSCSRWRSRCACGGSARACPTRTTPTRTPTSCRALSGCSRGVNPHYFANPPAFTDLLHLVFSVWFGGRAGVDHTFATNPTAVFTVARVLAALLGTVAVWLLYLAGARLFDRGVALLAAALEAVAFLPVFYAHLALNDVPTLAPLTLSLLGTAGVLRRGRARDYLLAGVGLGLGCATKYTAGIVLLPLLAAAAAQYLAPPQDGQRGARRPAGLSASCSPGSRRSSRSSWPTPTPCSTSTPSSRASPTSPRSPAKRRASWAPRTRAASSTTSGRSPGVSAGCRRWPRSGARSPSGGASPASVGCSCPRRCSTSPSWARRAATSGAGCCRSFRSSACSRRSLHSSSRGLWPASPSVFSNNERHRSKIGQRSGLGPRSASPLPPNPLPARRGVPVLAEFRSSCSPRSPSSPSAHRGSSTAFTPGSCSPAPTPAL